jgi:hypothetical protein
MALSPVNVSEYPELLGTKLCKFLKLFFPLKSLFFIYLYTSFTIFVQYTFPAAGFIQYDAPLGELKEMYFYIEQ